MKFGSTSYLKKIDINSTSFAITKIKDVYHFDMEFFCNHILNEKTLIDFAFPSHRQSFRNSKDFRNKIKRAAQKVYTTKKYQSRGEFGELIMHVLIRDFYAGIPLVRKIFFKSAVNDTVKGYDCVFVVKSGMQTNLWLGEAKLHTSIDSVYPKLRNSLLSSMNADYLENEFICLADHIDEEFEDRDIWVDIMSNIRSHSDLGTIFDRVIIPIFVGYETAIYSNKDTIKRIKDEAEAIEFKIRSRNSDLNFDFVIMMLPIDSKKLLLAKLNEVLRGF